jgi:hypothetical protein
MGLQVREDPKLRGGEGCLAGHRHLAISLGQDGLTSMSAAVAGGVIAFYQIGYGIPAFGLGPLLDRGADLPTLFGWAAVVTAAMGPPGSSSRLRTPNSGMCAG